MKILFMGTPDFAVFSLDALEAAGEEIIGVVTQADKPQGRGYVLTPPPVKVWAEKRGIPVYQPATLRGEEFAALLGKIDPEAIVVAAFGKILPENVIKYPKFGCINVHGSYLPEYRGAAPMQRAIIDGKDYTGVTIMYMDVGLDTGDMLARKKIAIGIDDNFETMHDRIGSEGAALLVETLKLIETGKAERIKQDDTLSTYAKKIEKSDCLVDFSKPAKEVHDLIRGLSPIPLSVTRTPNGKLLKLAGSKLTDVPVGADVACGTVVSVDGGVIRVACTDFLIAITEVVPEGKRRMPAADFINGRGVKPGDVLSNG